jgi:hypothetical protein
MASGNPGWTGWRRWLSTERGSNQAIDCGDRVLLLQSSSGRLEGSTNEVTLTPAVVHTIRDRKIARFEP